MNIGEQGLDLIKSFEGLELKAYMPTPNDVPTIGYGHTKTVEMGMVITEERAETLLLTDLIWVEDAVAKMVAVPLTQPQYDALCSFVYNLGGTNFGKSTMLRKLNAGDYKGAAAEFPRWNKQGKKVLRGLTRRRAAEMALFLSGGLPSAKSTEGAPAGLVGALMAILALFIKAKGK